MGVHSVHLVHLWFGNFHLAAGLLLNITICLHEGNHSLLHRHFAEGMIAAILIARKNPNAIQLVDIFIGGSKQLRGIVEGIFLCLLR